MRTQYQACHEARSQRRPFLVCGLLLWICMRPSTLRTHEASLLPPETKYSPTIASQSRPTIIIDTYLLQERFDLLLGHAIARLLASANLEHQNAEAVHVDRSRHAGV